MMGHPPIETRAALYRADGRIDFWLGLIKKYGPHTGSVLEIGCAPGLLLSELARSGYKCVGVEPDESVADWIRQNVQVDVREGLFPAIALPPCDLFLAFDVAEHTPEPLAFWRGIADVLSPGGVAILQTPIECRDYIEPFKTRRDFFGGVEHLYLYTDMSIRELARIANLRLVALEDAMGGDLSQFCVLVRPANSDQGASDERHQSG
jgi:SAM-dependent methyltransferase